MTIKYLYQESVIACENEPLKVSLNGDGLISGEIRKVAGGYQYFHKSKEPKGEVLGSVSAVQQALSKQL